MMDPATIEDAKRACLKQSFGGAIDSRERELLTTFLETEEGQRYMSESDDMKNLLSDVAVVEPVDSAQMVTDFETMMRERLHSVRRNMPWAFVCTSGVWGVVGTLCLASGKPHLAVMGWSLLVLAAFFVAFVIAMWRKQTLLLADDDLIARLEEDKQLARTPVVQARGVALAVAFVGLLGYAVAETLGTVGVLSWIIGSAVLLGIGSHFYYAQKRKDRKLWDWWEGR